MNLYVNNYSLNFYVSGSLNLCNTAVRMHNAKYLYFKFTNAINDQMRFEYVHRYIFDFVRK